jgi:hypothetical protein
MRRLLVVAVLLGACTQSTRVPAPAIAPPAASPTVTTPAPPPSPSPRVVVFTRDVRPILQAKCQPCHFAGGRMYEKLPFDREETIHQLGTRLFTRLKTEEEQRVINELLAQRR